ncbi:hypothetical protein K469DRAFT_561378 [Zopfia rhizophila CBS 207.26]|uniref:Rhodopsin domain-containing protein n=1 Tax=Zopfia rhizophila CBS 207.26 TaxID=1314779 RepID=A0A6A6EJL0_9PEZI|nr:hypothetical protein K469DRAFT_561378 [Zopfia rhizophila CBS 207.26]
MVPLATPSGSRFARYTQDNHSAPIWIASILCLLFAYAVLSVRLGFVKWNLHGLDDVILTLAHLVGLGMWAALYSSLANGLGRALKLLSEAETSHMTQSFSASRILLFIALGSSKCSVLVFVQSIFDYIKNVLLVANATMGIVAAWALAGALAVSLGCSPDHIVFEQENAHCVNDVTLTIVDIITEIVIILLPILPLRNLHMPQKRKFLVLLAFSFRVPNVVTSVMHLKSYSDFIHSGDRGVAIATLVVWQNALLSYNFMSATIPTLKGFMIHFTTGGLGYTHDMSTIAGSGGGGTSSNHTYKMQSLSKVKAKVALPQGYPESTTRVTSVPRCPQKDTGKAVRRVGDGNGDWGKQESESIASHDSRKIMIRKD